MKSNEMRWSRRSCSVRGEGRDMTKMNLTTRNGERIAVVAGLRTPFAKQATAFHSA